MLVSAGIISHLTLGRLLPKLKSIGMTGADMHKPGKPEVAEMGGIAIVVGFVGAAILGIILHTFFGFRFRLAELMAALLTATIVAIVGIFDDLFDMRQAVKAALPLAAAVPLMAVEMASGHSSIAIPFLGSVDFGLAYALLLVPLAVAVCSNLTNMLAGFNGLEAGLGAIMFGTLAVVAALNGQTEMALLMVAMLGAILGFLPFNWYPARAFIGDVGTLAIGAALAAGVIISNLKSAGAILTIPFVVDFFLKARCGFPKTFCENREGKLYPPKGKIRGLADLVLTVFGGLSEKRLVAVLLLIELCFAAVVLALYVKPA